jgi:hypothetical protein
MNESLITSEEKNKLAILFSGGLISLDILWGENAKALSDAWKKAQQTSEALKDMKSLYALQVLFPVPRAYAKLFSYLGLSEDLGVTLIDITLLLLIANGRELHFRKGGGMMHVSRFKDLHRLNLSYKLEFLDTHKLGFVSKIVNKNLRNMIAHLGFTITEDGTIRDSDNKEIDIDAEIEAFWNRVGEIIATFDDRGLLRFIEQESKKA